MITHSILRGIVYSILHGWQGLPEHLPSDLDIGIAPSDLPKLERALLGVDGTKLVQLLQHESSCYYFMLAVENGGNVRCVPVDAATDYRRNGRVWFCADELLQNRRQWQGFWVASPEVEFKYLLVKKILKANVPEYSRQRFKELVQELGEEAEGIAERLLGGQWGKEVVLWIRSEDWQAFEDHLKRLKGALLRECLRRDPLNPFRYWIPELWRAWRRWRYPTGLFVAVLGPDGAGKSTLIENLKTGLAGAFRRVESFHLMPRILGSKGDGGPVTDPHGKPPRSWPISVAKLLYYLLNYALGYALRIRLLLVRSTLVLFDRYYDDLLVDPRRYRYGGPPGLVRLFQRVIPRPDLVLILDVPEEQIASRKREVDHAELVRQRRAYRELAAGLHNAILLDASAPAEEVLRYARDAIVERLHARYLSRRHLWFPREDPLSLLQPAIGLRVTRASGDLKKEYRRYVVLSSHDGRGYLLPSNPRQAAEQGLSLWSPQSRKARLVRSLLGAGLRWGVAQRFLPAVDVEGVDELLEVLWEVFKRPDLEIAISLGTPGPQRNPVLQMMTGLGEVLGYVKVGWNARTRALVRNEAETLRALEGRPLPFAVPRVIYIGGHGGKFLCAQTASPLGMTEAPRELNRVYLETLKTLAKLWAKRRCLKDSDFWEMIRIRRNQIANTYWRHVLDTGMAKVEEALRDQEIPFHLCHGDFAPWNGLQMARGLYLYDWEYALREAPAGYDVFHWLVHTVWVLHRWSPGRIQESAILGVLNPMVAEYWEQVAVVREQIPFLYLLYLLDRFSFYAVEEPRAFEKIQLYANLITLAALGYHETT